MLPAVLLVALLRTTATTLFDITSDSIIERLLSGVSPAEPTSRGRSLTQQWDDFGVVDVARS